MYVTGVKFTFFASSDKTRRGSRIKEHILPLSFVQDYLSLNDNKLILRNKNVDIA